MTKQHTSGSGAAAKEADPLSRQANSLGSDAFRNPVNEDGEQVGIDGQRIGENGSHPDSAGEFWHFPDNNIGIRDYTINENSPESKHTTLRVTIIGVRDRTF
jgi:hypothetical protein